MKPLKFTFTGSLVILAILAGSCTKDATRDDKANLDRITGTYHGTFMPSNRDVSSPGIAEVLINDNDQILVHCYGDILDTTIIMNAYENGDSIMVCDTSEDFDNDEGHMMNDGGMMDGYSDGSEWMQHLGDDHQPGDLHFGSFDMPHHSFGYSFRMHDGSGDYELVFQGTRGD